MTQGQQQPDFAAITGRQQQTWATGDFNVLAMQVVPVAEALVAAVNPHAGQRVLDVACGSGNAALVAARRYCEVVGIDYVPALVARAKQRAASDGVTADFREGDAQALAFADASFDVILSTFGVMFAPDQEKAATELLRVCKPGGRIGLANWMPEGFGGELFKTVSKYVPPPAGLKPGVRWGTDAGLNELLGSGTTAIESTRRTFTQYFHSVDHAIDVVRTYFGPVARAFALQADDAARGSLHADIATVFNRHNRSTNGTLMMECDYLQVMATRQ